MGNVDHSERLREIVTKYRVANCKHCDGFKCTVLMVFHRLTSSFLFGVPCPSADVTAVVLTPLDPRLPSMPIYLELTCNRFTKVSVYATGRQVALGCALPAYYKCLCIQMFSSM